MAHYFLDTSALVKRYIQEVGTNWVRGLFLKQPRNQVTIARITAVEVVSALTRRRLTGSLTAIEAGIAMRRFRRDLHNRFIIIPITGRLVESSMQLVERHGLRGYDAVQLAAATALSGQLRRLGVAPPIFVTADAQLNSAAVAEGLAVDDPNAHP